MGKYPHFTIGEICNIEKGETGIANATPGDYPLVNTSAARKSCDTYQFDTEAVCIPLVSSTGHGKKTLNYVHYQKGKFALGTILAAVIPKEPHKLSAAFLHRYLQFNKDWKIVPLMKGAANVSLAIKDIAKIEVPVPPINEQTSVIGLFNKLNDSSTELQYEFSTQSFYLALLRQAILQEAIEGKLTAAWRKKNPKLISGVNHASKLLEKIKAEKEQLIKEGKIKKQEPLPPIKPEEVPYLLPGGWEWCRLGDVGIIGSSSRVHQRDWTNKGIPFFRAREIVKLSKFGTVENALFITEELFHALSKSGTIPEPGDLMITGVGTIGIPYIVKLTDKFYFKDASVLIFKNHFKLFPQFMYHFLKSPYWINKIHSKSMGTTVHTLTIIRANEIPIPLPALAEQQAIVERVDKLMTMIDELEKQVTERKDKSERLMQSVLREAFEVV